ncbi:MFS transporter [Streptomyces sp. NBC_01264]|uniref:MFS transporter n=1 Tax=Streptomyces sp. NBC_01264 TaxID=2903804 RepID=UPI00224F100A|nr:MFS transporter [Streptomyces sp. NBC_01264]MCX4782573.1 MFS transporter [Streptomyces sp. NBC_01264]
MTGQRTGLIHNRSFTLFWLGQALSVLGGSVSMLALPLVVLDATGSLVELGLITALSGVFAIATGTFAGHVVDRVDRRRLMIGCDLARAVLLGSVPLAWSFGGPRIWWLYVLTALVTVLKTLFDVAYVSAVPSLVEPADLVAANGRLMGTFALGTLLGPVVAGLLVAGVDGSWALALDGATFLVSGISLRWVRFGVRGNAATPRPPRKSTSLREVFVVGFRFLWAHALLRPLTVLLTLLTFVTIGATDLLIFRLSKELDRPPATIGYVMAVSGIGIVCASFAAGPLRRTLGFGPCWLGSTALIGLSVAGMGVSRSVALIAVMAVLFMFGLTLGGICSMTLRQEVTPDHLLGRVTSAFWTVHNASGPVGAAALTALSARHGVPSTSLAAGTFCLLIAGTGLLTPLRSARPGPPPKPVAGAGGPLPDRPATGSRRGDRPGAAD